MLIFLFLFNQIFAQPITDSFLNQLLSSSNNKIVHQVLKDPTNYRLQIIYTKIDRDKKNHSFCNNFYYNYDPSLYFNPASMVKLPLAILALEKLNKMNIAGVNKYTAMQFDSSYKNQSAESHDSSAENGLPSIAHYIKKVFLVSDNNAYNRLYEFVGQQTINEELHKKGYDDVRITRQFKAFNADQNRHTNQVDFLNDQGKIIYTQSAAYNEDSFHFPAIIKVGKGRFDANDSLINEPMDFTTHNNISLKDLEQILQSVMFPKSVNIKQRFDLTKEDLDFLHRCMSQLPSETSYPKYDTSKYYDSYVKFYFKNSSHKLPEGVRVFNKVGWSYGFLTDVSYIADFKNKIEFMLAATLYVNSDGILNDDKYDYDSIGYPFLYEVGQMIYQYELKRNRKYVPDLSSLKMNYQLRPADVRPVISQSDN